MYSDMPGHDSQTELITDISDAKTEEEPHSGLLRIGQLSEQCDKTVRALHLYEEMGLLIPIHRTKGGFRLYESSAVERVKWIGRLQDADLSLGEIREFLHEISQEQVAKKTMGRLQALLQKKLSEVRKQKQKLENLEDDLRQGLAYLDACRVCEPERGSQDCESCRFHGHTDAPPLMIAGLHHQHRMM